MNSVIVTGANGFIGRHLSHYLASLGVDVFAVVREMPSEKIDDKNIHYIVWDSLGDYLGISCKLPEEADAFIHLAWYGTAPEQRNVIDKQMKSITLALHAVELSSSVHAKRFILPGSTMEYALNEKPISPELCPKPLNFFGAAKASTRFLCQSLCAELNIPFIYAVITGVYGVGRNDSNVITYAISQLLDGNCPKFTRLEQLWDYVHIDDVVEALYLIAEKGKQNGFYMIGHGDNWALSNYIYQIRDCINPSLPLGIGEIPYQGGKMPQSCIDLTAIRRDTGFTPHVKFSEGVKDLILEMKSTKAK